MPDPLIRLRMEYGPNDVREGSLEELAADLSARRKAQNAIDGSDDWCPGEEIDDCAEDLLGSTNLTVVHP